MLCKNAYSELLFPHPVIMKYVYPKTSRNFIREYFENIFYSNLQRNNVDQQFYNKPNNLIFFTL